ncbi:uncharacterized protein FIBRA_02299 [Fibroporia radiculosa]|uniref:FK506-binding protein n=1 Tax=Fibroporia radiculosa TaxID=599839 RepID=J4H1S2_9APHY|nr:uncharacterized protein FIBRA_02299 [Fibroporia radiculosa]CCM00269.1 predicted protein [Fibroporia radiculosa]
MAVAIAVWSTIVKPGNPAELLPQSDLRITNIALGDKLEDESGRTTVRLIYRKITAEDSSDEEDDEKDEEDDDEHELEHVALCSLTPGKIEQAMVDVVLEGDQEYLIEVVGKNTVHLVGNYIDQTPPDQVPYNDESDEDSDEEDFDLRDVSSDVEIDPNEMDIPSDDEGRFEELPDDVELSSKGDAGKKRPRESDAKGADETPKSQKAKKKKQKGQDGKAVPVGDEKSTLAKSDSQAKDAKGKDEASKEAKSQKEDKKDKKDKEKKEIVLAGGVKVVDHKIGKGPKAKVGDMAHMRYVGKLPNGTVFDKNMKGEPFKFRLGKGEVIKGWDVGIVGMQPGGERLLTIPPGMGYGKKKMDKIPANSTLIFEIKLVQLS